MTGAEPPRPRRYMRRGAGAGAGLSVCGHRGERGGGSEPGAGRAVRGRAGGPWAPAARRPREAEEVNLPAGKSRCSSLPRSSATAPLGER